MSEAEREERRVIMTSFLYKREESPKQKPQPSFHSAHAFVFMLRSGHRGTMPGDPGYRRTIAESPNICPLVAMATDCNARGCIFEGVGRNQVSDISGVVADCLMVHACMTNEEKTTVLGI